MHFISTQQLLKMIKIILIYILCIISLAAIQYSPVTGINARPKAIARCLAENLHQHGYMLDTNETDIPGVGKEFTVYYLNSADIAGTFWIADSITGEPERTVGMYGVSKQAYPIFNESLQQCTLSLPVK
ncbi:hypothetical protein MOQ95_005399 [Salmonella enterica]|nr:hypothetical protein [Salmonella enterica]